MSDRDQELDDLLKPLMRLNPNDIQMSRWRKLIPISTKTAKAQIISRVLQLGAACLLGFVLGVEKENMKQDSTKKAESVATIEMIYTKSE